MRIVRTYARAFLCIVPFVFRPKSTNRIHAQTLYHTQQALIIFQAPAGQHHPVCVAIAIDIRARNKPIQFYCAFGRNGRNDRTPRVC